jgi:hypothetical protein
LGRSRGRWEDNVKMDHRETGWDGVDWVDVAEDRDQLRTLKHGNEPSGSIKCWEILE